MRLLLVENSKTVSSLLYAQLADYPEITLDWVDRLDKAVELIEEKGADSYGLVVTGLYLGDTDNGEDIVNRITEYQIPTVIFTAQWDDAIRDNMIQKPGVVDYVVKESRAALTYLSNLIKRLMANKNIKALIVDDSRAVRMHIGGLLRQYQFQVLEADHGQTALDLVDQHDDIKLVVTDYNMPEMDGFQLTKKLRERFERYELAIIGLSGESNPSLSARFMKIGANDFVVKPFQPEEFLTRVSQTMDLIEKTQALIDSATKDFLTGLSNRRHFFEKAGQQASRGRVQRKGFYLSILDIDHFKSVNDTYGHDVGDEVLIAVAQILDQTVGEQGFVARMGGEEFCIFLPDCSKEEAEVLFEKVRKTIEDNKMACLQERSFVTSSFGVVADDGESDLTQLLKQADDLLYQAKEGGRNRVIFQA